MIKELEAFDRIEQEINGCMYIYHIEENDIDVVKQALLELKTIKETGPSEAMKCLEEWYGFLMSDNDTIYSNGNENETEYNRRKEIIYKQYNTIKQALLQAKKDKAKIEKLKHDNAILHIQLDTFKKLAFKNKGEQCEEIE